MVRNVDRKVLLAEKTHKYSLVSCKGYKYLFSPTDTCAYEQVPPCRTQALLMWWSSQGHVCILEKLTLAGMARGWRLLQGVEFWSPGIGVPSYSRESVGLQQISCPCQDERLLHTSSWVDCIGNICKTPGVNPEHWEALGHGYCIQTTTHLPNLPCQAFSRICCFLSFLLFSHEHGCCSSTLSHFGYF